MAEKLIELIELTESPYPSYDKVGPSFILINIFIILSNNMFPLNIFVLYKCLVTQEVNKMKFRIIR